MRYAFLVLLVACKDKEPEDTAVPLSGPTLAHTPPATVVEGAALTFEVTATDPDGIGPVSLYHRVAGDPTWDLTPMDLAEGDTFTVTLEGDDVAAPGVEYYFKAEDAAEPVSYSYLPEESTAAPYEVLVSVVGQPVPFVEDFEYADTESSLYDIGWGNAGLGFGGYGWDTSATNAYDGVQSAYHSRGHTDIDPMEDWLISPALDLSTLTTAQVTWWERGSNVSAANHALYVSTGSRDPVDGDYVAVAETLPAPTEDAWGRSAVYDLSSYVGSQAVYVAWRFVGENSDDWFIDDVRVEELQADLGFSTSASPSPLDPGGSGTLTVTVANSGTVASSDLTVTVAFPEGGASVAEESATVTSVGAGSTGTADFTLAIDPGTLDNSYVPLTVSITDGTNSWTEEDQLLVGVASTATIGYLPSDVGSLELVIGVGDPDAPTWEETVYSDDPAGAEVALSLDITDHRESLPPAAGDLRWFLRASPEVAGAITDFTINYDGVDYVPDTLPAVDAGESGVCYVPEPPALDALATTTPSTLSPGDTGVTLALTVFNDGAPTSGPVVATLSSDDPDVMVTDGGPVSVSADVLGHNDAYAVYGFAFDVSSAHIDSSDVNLDLTLDDGVESWTVPLSFDVPYPYLKVESIEIDDDGRDEVLDADESADLTFEIANIGDLATTGDLTATLSAEATSTAGVTISGDPVSFDRIAAGGAETGDDPWAVTVDSGVDGDTVDLLLTLTDSVRSYEVRTTLTLGEPPWQDLDRSGDPSGDALSGWDFDIIGGSYRVNDGILQIRLESATVYDPSSLFIEAWGSSTVADWTYYRLVLQSGVVTLQGYDGSFTDITTPVVTYTDTTVQFDITVADLGLTLDTMSLGFATGWCGPDEYYCDHFPDGWGYPYTGWSPSLFFDLSW